MDKILRGEETRTNLMVKNIPCRYTYKELRSHFEVHHRNHFNFLKLPVDNQNSKTNKAYCFINFRHVLYVHQFVQNMKDSFWPKYESNKKIDFGFAINQPAMSPQPYEMSEMERDSLY